MCTCTLYSTVHCQQHVHVHVYGTFALHVHVHVLTAHVHESQDELLECKYFKYMYMYGDYFHYCVVCLIVMRQD